MTNNNKKRTTKKERVQLGETPAVVLKPKANYIKQGCADNGGTKGETPDVIIKK